MTIVKQHTRRTKKGTSNVRGHTRRKISPINMGRLADFIDDGGFDIRYFDDKITDVSLKWGEGKNLKILGYSREEQTNMINWLRDNPAKAKELLEKNTYVPDYRGALIEISTRLNPKTNKTEFIYGLIDKEYNPFGTPEESAKGFSTAKQALKEAKKHIDEIIDEQERIESEIAKRN